MLKTIKLLPVYLLYIATFGFAGGGKFAAGGVPEWFTKQFGGTILNPFPGALAANFYLIATLEVAVALTFVASLARREFLPGQDRRVLAGGLWLATLVFAMLAFGEFMTGQHEGAANLFFYFGATVVISRYCEV